MWAKIVGNTFQIKPYLYGKVEEKIGIAGVQPVRNRLFRLYRKRVPLQRGTFFTLFVTFTGNLSCLGKNISSLVFKPYVPSKKILKCSLDKSL